MKLLINLLLGSNCCDALMLILLITLQKLNFMISSYLDHLSILIIWLLHHLINLLILQVFVHYDQLMLSIYSIMIILLHFNYHLIRSSHFHFHLVMIILYLLYQNIDLMFIFINAFNFYSFLIILSYITFSTSFSIMFFIYFYILMLINRIKHLIDY
jgi:hypothetical protein